MADISEFQRKKILHVFSTFFDINNDGVIEWQDFEIFVEKIQTLHRWSQNDERLQKARDTSKLIWDGLKEYADENQDNQITREEWLKMWAECVRTGKSDHQVPEWQHQYMDLMFTVNDTSGDAYIDKTEYATVYTSYGLSTEECNKAFEQFASDGRVDRDLFNKLWREYFHSEDPSSPGNHLFGIV